MKITSINSISTDNDNDIWTKSAQKVGDQDPLADHHKSKKVGSLILY